MKLPLICLLSATLLTQLSLAIYHDCPALVPQEPCFKWDCFGKGRWGSKPHQRYVTRQIGTWEGAETLHDNTKLVIQNSTLLLTAFDCNDFKEGSGSYHECLELKNKPHIIPLQEEHSDIPSLEMDAKLPVNLNLASTPIEFDKNCCRITDVCYDLLQDIGNRYGPGEEITRTNHPKEWEQIWCCFRLNLWSCSDQESYQSLPQPNAINRALNCSNPGMTFGG